VARQSEYLLADGSPRYGIRTADAPAVPASAASKPLAGKLPVEIAAGLHRQHLAMAAALRTVRLRTDDATERVARLRTDHVVEYALAVAAAEEHLGSPRKWRQASLENFSEEVTSPVMKSRSGMSRFVILGVAILCFTAGIPVLAIGLPFMGHELLVVLTVLWTYLFLGAKAVGHLYKKRRYPEKFALNGYLVRDLYEDVVDATLVCLLQDKGVEIDPVTEKMATRGWRDIQAVAAKVDEIYGL
jgi:hypothetical protein